MSRVRSRLLALDAAATFAIGALACVLARSPHAMLVAVVAVVALRTAAWIALSRAKSLHAVCAEIALFAACAVLGGFNDWNTVDRHRVYAYLVPTDLAWSSIPLWMMGFWGQILRTVASAAAWARGDDPMPRNVRFAGRTCESVPARVAVMLVLVFATRQGIYRLWDHPLWSWAPFAVAIVVYIFVLSPGRAGLRLALIALTVGPPAEAALIGFGDLHRYALGWFLGVPLWIVLWWVLAAWIWGELSGRLDALTSPFPATLPEKS